MASRRAPSEHHQRQQSFYAVLTAAMKDMAEHGFDSPERLERWMRALKDAARASLVPEAVLERNLREMLLRTYVRKTKEPAILNRFPALEPWTLERIKPKLRAELDRRILASAALIRLNRDASIERTLQRFAGWATAIPIGGARLPSVADDAKVVRKGISSLPFIERRVVIDQGHKLAQSIDEIIAADSGAIGAVWQHVKEIGYDARPWHRARDGEFFVVRDNWAMKKGWMKLAGHTYIDAIVDAKGRPDGPSIPVYCRCTWRTWAMGLDDLAEMAPECLTEAGRAAIKRADLALGGGFMTHPTAKWPVVTSTKPNW